MPKKRNHERCPQPKNSPDSLERAQQAIATIALREGISTEQVRTQIKLAMLCGLVNNDSQVQSAWGHIPHDGEVPTPEELIAFCADKLTKS